MAEGQDVLIIYDDLSKHAYCLSHFLTFKKTPLKLILRRFIYTQLLEQGSTC